MEAIDEELDALAFGGEKYASLSSAEKAAIFKKLQAEMQKLIKVAKENDPTKLSLSQINKKSHNLQKRIREIADNSNIKGTVTEGPKKDMIAALYDGENAALRKARQVITKRNSELKYGKKYPVLDPENDTFIVIGLDEFGHPIKMSRFTGKFSATKDKTTGELTSGEGTSFYDKWNAETNQMRKKGEEVFHETLNREGKVIMSNPEYKIPKTPNLDIQTEFYTDLSTSDLAKKGYTLKQVDMIRKGREVRKYLDRNKSLDVNIRMHEQTSTNDIGPVLEDLYNRGDDIYKMSIEEWVKKIPEYFAEGGQVPGFATGGISNLFRQRYRSGKAVELVTKLPEFLKFVERLLIKASNEIRQGVGKWKGLTTSQRVTQHDNLTKLATEFQKTKKFDKSFNEYFGIDAEKAFVEVQSKVEKEYLDKGIAEGAVEQIENLKLAKSKGELVKGGKWFLKSLHDTKKQLMQLNIPLSQKKELMTQADDAIKHIESGGSIPEQIIQHIRKDPKYRSVTQTRSTDPDLAEMEEVILEYGKKHATGGLIQGYATGGVSNLFRSR